MGKNWQKKWKGEREKGIKDAVKKAFFIWPLKTKIVETDWNQESILRDFI